MTTENTAPTTLDDLVPKMELKGMVKKIELYGALVDIGVGRPGLLHISQLTDGHVKNVTDVLSEGAQITVWVQEIDRKRGRINLTMIKPPAVGWSEIAQGNVYTGTVVRVEKFGAFVDIGAERPGLVHVSELAKSYVGDPSDVVSVGDELQVKVIGINRRKKQIDLSVRAVDETTKLVEETQEQEESLPTAMELALRRAMEGSGMQLPRVNPKRQKRSKRREDREDIFARTLQQHAKD